MPFISMNEKTRFWLAIGLGIGLLMVGMAACNRVAAITNRDPLPQLLQVIEQPEEISTTDIAVIQGGYAYVLNESTDSIAVFGFAEPEQPSLWQQFLPFLQR